MTWSIPNVFGRLPVVEQLIDNAPTVVRQVYQSTYRDTFTSFETPPARDVLPQIRKVAVEQGLAVLATDLGFRVAWCANERKNCSHLEIASGDVVLTAHRSRRWDSFIRNAKYRQRLDAANPFYLPGIVPLELGDLPLHMMILHGPNPERIDMLGHLSLVVPSYHGKYYISTLNILARVAAAQEAKKLASEVAAVVVPEAETIQDEATPRIRKNRREAAGE